MSTSSMKSGGAQDNGVKLKMYDDSEGGVGMKELRLGGREVEDVNNMIRTPKRKRQDFDQPEMNKRENYSPYDSEKYKNSRHKV